MYTVKTDIIIQPRLVISFMMFYAFLIFLGTVTYLFCFCFLQLLYTHNDKIQKNYQ